MDALPQKNFIPVIPRFVGIEIRFHLLVGDRRTLVVGSTSLDKVQFTESGVACGTSCWSWLPSQ